MSTKPSSHLISPGLSPDSDDAPWLPLGTLVIWLAVLGIGAFTFVAPILSNLVTPPPKPLPVPPPPIELKLEPPPRAQTAPTQSQVTRESFTPPSSLPPFLPSPAISTLPSLPAIEAPALLEIKTRAVLSPAPPVQRQAVEAAVVPVAAAAKVEGPTELKPGVGAGAQEMPRYPRLARQRGQQGEVKAEIKVDKSGKISSLHLKAPCPWEALNNEVLRVIREEWIFPPGDERHYTMTFQFLLKEKKP